MTPFADTWANAPVDGDSNDPPDPGTYYVSVQDARAFVSKAGKDTMVVEFRVLDGPKEGYIYPVFFGFEENRVGITKKFVASLGVDIDQPTLEALDAALKLIVGTYYTVDVVQRGTFRNTFVNGRMTGAEVPTPVSDVPGAAEGEFEPVSTPVTGETGEPLPW